MLSLCIVLAGYESEVACVGRRGYRFGSSKQQCNEILFYRAPLNLVVANFYICWITTFILQSYYDCGVQWIHWLYATEAFTDHTISTEMMFTCIDI